MNILDKQLLVQIEALARRDQGCTATNAYLAASFGVSERSVTRAVARLQEAGLIVASYTASSWRTIRLTPRAIDLWRPVPDANECLEHDRQDVQGGRQDVQGGRHLGEQMLEEDIEEESARAHATSSLPNQDLYPDESVCLSERKLSPARAQGEQTRQADDDDTRLRAELIAIGFSEFQADAATLTAKQNGRSNDWVRQWLDVASRDGRKPDCYAFRMIEANKELPKPRTDLTLPRRENYADDDDPYSRTVSPERAAHIQSRSDTECERTRRLLNEMRQGARPTDEEMAASGFVALREQLRNQLTVPERQSLRRREPMSDADLRTLAEVRRELERRGKEQTPSARGAA